MRPGSKQRGQMPGLATLSCNVADTNDVAGLFEAVERDLGDVANVGIGGPTLSAEELPLAEASVMDVNLTGTFDVVHRAIPLIRAAKGTIAIMSSAAGRLAYPIACPMRSPNGDWSAWPRRWRPSLAGMASTSMRSCLAR